MRRFRVLSLLLVAVVAFCVGCGSEWSDLDKSNEEVHRIKTAIEVCLADADVDQLDSAVVAWDGSLGKVTATSGRAEVFDAASYLTGGSFKATYDISQTGLITNAHNISWKGVEFDASYPQIFHWAKVP